MAMEARSTTRPAPSALSGAERAALIAEITGRPLAFRVITEEQMRARLTDAGLPVGADNIVVSIQASFAAGAFDIVTGDVERVAGRPPKLFATCWPGR
jgi:NAD(P)H dehydrogenase (quinone)